MTFQIIDTGKNSAESNMALDTKFLSELRESMLHLYDWENDSATYGHFIDPTKFFRKSTLSLAKRPTGGGIVFHIADFAFSILVPSSHPNFSINPLDNYLFINQKVAEIIEKFVGEKISLLSGENPLQEAFCMAKPTKYDLLLRGKKVGGAAQRKTKAGYLHQGSILLGQLKDEYLEKILLDPILIQKMKENSFPLIQGAWSESQLRDARDALKSLFKKVFSEPFDF